MESLPPLQTNLFEFSLNGPCSAITSTKEIRQNTILL